MLVRRLLAATVVLPLLLVAGCSDDEPEPIMPTTSSPTTSPSSTPTVDPLAIPEEAKKPTKAGAEALVRHYFDMFNHFLESGDSVPVKQLYGERCSYCEVPIQVFELAQSKGHTYTGSEEIRRIRVSLLGKGRGDLGALALVTTKQAAIVERDPAGKVVSRIPPNASQDYEYYLAFNSGTWKITNVVDAQ